MRPNELDTFFEQLPGIRALVLGDVMIDRYSYVRHERMSPEAPVPVWDVVHRESRPGGAGHVALNLQSLGCQVRLLGLAGQDADGVVLRNLLNQQGLDDRYVVASPNRRTTLKHRIIADTTHLARLDEEDRFDANMAEEAQLQQALLETIDETDVLILQDYNKGVLSAPIIQFACMQAQSRGIPVAVDPKKQNFFAFRNVSLFKPNHKELCEAMGQQIPRNDVHGLMELMRECRDRLGAESMLLTLSEEGILYDRGDVRGHLPAGNLDVVDVSGAGDSVISVAACALAAKLPMDTIAALSNLAGGLACTRSGVCAVALPELKSAAQAIALPENA